MKFGEHCIKAWSSNQAVFALSSGEAELNAALKGAAELLGLRELLLEMGVQLKLALYGDSTACRGTLMREGAGKVKHLQVRQLWLQQYVRDGILSYEKIDRSRNGADALTKHWSADAHDHFRRAGCVSVP